LPLGRNLGDRLLPGACCDFLCCFGLIPVCRAGPGAPEAAPARVRPGSGRFARLWIVSGQADAACGESFPGPGRVRSGGRAAAGCGTARPAGTRRWPGSGRAWRSGAVR